MDSVTYKGLEYGQAAVPITGGLGTITTPLLIAFVGTALVIGVGVGVLALMKRTNPTPGNLTDSNKSLQRMVIGVAVALLLVSVLGYINPSIVTGDIVFNKIKNRTTSSEIFFKAPTTPASRSTSVVGQACIDPSVVLANISSGNVCGQAVCSKVCTLTPSILTLIKEESRNANVNPSIIAALICRESGGVESAEGTLAQNNTPDCGLMQINSPLGCKQEIMDPRNNIRQGIQLYKQKLASVSRFLYRGVQPEMMAFASYNCCGEGDNPNTQSVSCNSSSGFTSATPKWACPLDPGISTFNMCKVKGYVCEVYACTQAYTTIFNPE